MDKWMLQPLSKTTISLTPVIHQSMLFILVADYLWRSWTTKKIKRNCMSYNSLKFLVNHCQWAKQTFIEALICSSHRHHWWDAIWSYHLLTTSKNVTTVLYKMQAPAESCCTPASDQKFPHKSRWFLNVTQATWQMHLFFCWHTRSYIHHQSIAL